MGSIIEYLEIELDACNFVSKCSLKTFCDSDLEIELDTCFYISKCSLKSFCQIWKKNSMTALISVRIFLQGFQILNKPVLTIHCPCQAYYKYCPRFSSMPIVSIKHVIPIIPKLLQLNA